MILVADVTDTWVFATLTDDQQASALADPHYAGQRIYSSVLGCGPLGPQPVRLPADRIWLNPPENLVAYASQRRWEIEVGGTSWNGWAVATDDRSKILTDGELTAIDLGVRQDGEAFKFADGIPRPLTNDQMKLVAIQMRAHVKDTFAALFQVLGGLQGGSVTTREQVDAILAQATP